MAQCNLPKSCSTISADWSTNSPSNVTEFFDLALNKMSPDYVVGDMIVDMEIHESVDDPLEWLVDLDTQQYLPESSLPMFPDFVDHVVPEPTSCQSYLVDDAVLNNMVEPSSTFQSLFPESDDFLDDL
jgi:hypothetical protein